MGGHPASTAETLSSGREPAASRVPIVALAMSGARKTFGSPLKRRSCSGSVRNALSPAAESRPEVRASTPRACFVTARPIRPIATRPNLSPLGIGLGVSGKPNPRRQPSRMIRSYSDAWRQEQRASMKAKSAA
ncbi:MAG: hypothetical protein ICV73_00980 [Acetobacteraceae bacterium]|nr:hypothetical protein [Acetobacteraceae bacterium]